MESLEGSTRTAQACLRFLKVFHALKELLILPKFWQEKVKINAKKILFLVTVRWCEQKIFSTREMATTTASNVAQNSHS
jgi:hypothetical protein